ncbi:MAG: ABC transporter ATP-binding protein [Lutisporaceae bacterium]|jgi:ABC-type uncharacterized transport system ATPase subunit
MENYALEMRHIHKSFGPVHANNDVSLAVRKSKVHALIGENGAGKSTLMSILSNVLKPDSGEIIINGKKVIFKDPLDATLHGIGMVYQEFMQFSGMTVLDNIILGFEEKKSIFIDYAAARKRIESLCEQYNFQLPLDEKIDELPVATLQQVEIVKVLYREAEIIILDEPTSVLTPQGIEGLFKAIRSLVAKGKTVIIITHKLKEVLRISDDITVMKEGRVTGYLSAAETNEAELARLMVGREVMLQVEKLPCNPGETVLSVNNLSVKDNKDILRVKDASFDIRGGEILGISGVAGSGQKELIQAIIGLCSPEAGAELFIDGISLSNKSIADRRKMGMGYVAQDRNKVGTNREGAIWETAIMGYHLLQDMVGKFIINYKEVNRFTNDIVIDYAVKTENINNKVRTLSGGNVQKLLVGREFSQDKRLLIIEDPTRGIDVGAIEFIWKKIIEIAASGVAILLVSHDLNEIMQLSDRCLVMYNGELYPVTAENLHDERAIGLLMLGGAACEAKS